MAFATRVPLRLSKLLNRGVNNGVNYYHAFKPVVCSSTLGASNFSQSQARYLSDVRLPDVTEFVTPIAPTATIFSDLPPVLLTQDLLCQLHDFSGLAWAPTIVLTTLGLRFVTGLTITVIQQKSATRLLALNPELKRLGEDLAREVAIAKKLYNWDDRQTKRNFKQSFKKHYKKLFVEHNCHPMRVFALPVLQLPLWVCISSSIRNLASMLPANVPDTTEQQYRYMQMAVENPGFIESLVIPDPFILPGLFILVNLINIQLHSSNAITVPQSFVRKAIPWCLRGAIVGIGLLGAYFPSAVTTYWVASSVGGLLVTILLRLNILRRLFRLPPLPSKLPTITSKIPFLGRSKSTGV